METSLMAIETDSDPTVPLLASGPPVEEESEFSRLMANSGEDHILGFQRLIPDEVSFNFDTPGSGVGGGRHRVVVHEKPRGPLLTMAAGTLCVVHLFLVWGSYVATAWTQTRLTISIDWLAQYLPFLDDIMDQVIRTTSLASFLQDLGECQAYTLMILVWAAALVVPCLFMVVSPTLVVGDYVRPIEIQSRRVNFDGRTFLELVTRFAWVPIYAMAVISLSTSFVDLEWTATNIQAGLQSKNPFAAYIVGTLCSVCLVVVLRLPRKESFRIVPVVAEMEIDREFTPSTPVRSPPPQAFRHSWNVENEDVPLMTVLEEDALHPPVVSSPTRFDPPRTPIPDDATPDLIEEATTTRESSFSSSLSYWDKVKVFQLGLLSVVLWIPAYYLPLLHFSYTGVASDFMKRSSLRLYLWEIPGYLWSQGRDFDTPVWIATLVILFMATTVLLLPLLVTFQGVLAWLGEGAWRTRSYVWLYTLQPLLGGLVFSLTLVTTVPALSPMGVLLLNEQLSGGGACHGLLGDPCLSLKARLLSGGVFYLVQSVCLEAFVLLTLRWSRRS